MGKSLISNPPYNMKWQLPLFAQTQERFKEYELPPESNSNFAFVLTALNLIDDKMALLLPNGILTTQNVKEAEIRKQLIENNLLEAVVVLPNNMFVSTSIGTCVLLFSKHKINTNVVMIDLRHSYEEEERLQNGQFGGKSHEKRTYSKTFKIITHEVMKRVLECIENHKNVPEFSKSASLEEIREQKYLLNPARYIEYELTKEERHRNYKEIVENLNYIMKMQNSCKLVINETIAKKLGFDIDLYKNSKRNSLETQKNMKSIGIDIEIEDYIQFTKNKNEFCFKCNDKEILPDILLQFFSVWKNQIALLNTMQNQYLTELRDALLPDLMSGKIKLE